MEDRIAHGWYQGCYWLSASALTLGWSLRTEGYQNVPSQGPVLLIANHESFFDTVLVGLAARRHLCYLGRHSLFRNKAFTWLIRSLGAVPINQEGFAREGLTTILDQLRASKAVIVFPEGLRTHDGAMEPFRPGIHLMIKKIDMPVVPVGIAGAFEAWPRHRLVPTPAPLFLPAQPGHIAVSIGPAIHTNELRELPRAEVLSRLQTAVQNARNRADKLRRKCWK
jgi:1-acyl-sn-glycerol-3-phosphate acyltransferase